MGAPEYIAIASVLAAVLGVLVTWLVMKRQFASKKLTYSYEIEPIVQSADPDLARDLKVFYKGGELPEPALLSLVISNTGLTAIENATVIVELPGTTYLIPGYFADVPAGYAALWDIERTNAEECAIKFKHINPGHVARVRLLMDELPKAEPLVSCPMPNVECVRASPVTVGIVAKTIVEVVAPQLLRSLRI